MYPSKQQLAPSPNYNKMVIPLVICRQVEENRVMHTSLAGWRSDCADGLIHSLRVAVAGNWAVVSTARLSNTLSTSSSISSSMFSLSRAESNSSFNISSMMPACCKHPLQRNLRLLTGSTVVSFIRSDYKSLIWEVIILGYVRTAYLHHLFGQHLHGGCQLRSFHKIVD